MDKKKICIVSTMRKVKSHMLCISLPTSRIRDSI